MVGGSSNKFITSGRDCLDFDNDVLFMANGFQNNLL
jgi:hypothetical protein